MNRVAKNGEGSGGRGPNAEQSDLDLFYDRAPCGYLTTTPDGSLLDANATFVEWCGYEHDQLTTRRLVDLLSVGGRLYLETHVMPMLFMQGFVREIALELVRPDGGRLPVLLNASLDRDEQGTPTMVRVVLLDVTERRAYERELLAATKRAEESEGRLLALAQTLQQAFIPPVPPLIPGLDVAGVYRPAGAGDQVGGDFYDVFQVNDDEWVVALGDVCGKGVEAAVVTSLVQHTVRAASVTFHDPTETLRHLNAVMLEGASERFCTLVVARLRRAGSGWHVDQVLGGHPMPLVHQPGADTRFFGTPGSLIGVIDRPDLHTSSLHAGPGTTLVLYTDGVTEGRRGSEFYGEARLHAVVDSLVGGSAEEVADGLLADLLAFQHQRATDDIAVVVLRVPD
jgi:sigma-B regulation protein RsbU (phosphoserine phosphatase)